MAIGNHIEILCVIYFPMYPCGSETHSRIIAKIIIGSDGYSMT